MNHLLKNSKENRGFGRIGENEGWDPDQIKVSQGIRRPGPRGWFSAVDCRFSASHVSRGGVLLRNVDLSYTHAKERDPAVKRGGQSHDKYVRITPPQHDDQTQPAK